MIIEALQHFFFKAPKHIKDMGYVKETIAIEARFKRCEKFWAPHLEKCKEQVLKAAEGLAEGANIMILGSGALHDVPIDALLAQKHHITCVDIVHLPRIVRTHKKITFLERDVTGLIEPLYNAVHNGARVQADAEWEFLKTPDLIISLNLLSQLAIKLVDYAEQYGEDLGLHFHDNVLKAHVKWLKKQETQVLLISDVAREYYQEDRLLETVPSLPKSMLVEPDEKWVWDIAPLGEADREISIRHTVGAWSL